MFHRTLEGTEARGSKYRILNHELRIMNILIIDTSDNKKVKVGIRINGEEDGIHQEVGREKAQAVLPLLDQLLREHQLKLREITGIEVNTGPGSFTGLRVGISIANALGYALHIPINGGKPGEPVSTAKPTSS